MNLLDACHNSKKKKKKKKKNSNATQMQTYEQLFEEYVEARTHLKEMRRKIGRAQAEALSVMSEETRKVLDLKRRARSARNDMLQTMRKRALDKITKRRIEREELAQQSQQQQQQQHQGTKHSSASRVDFVPETEDEEEEEEDEEEEEEESEDEEENDEDEDNEDEEDDNNNDNEEEVQKAVNREKNLEFLAAHLNLQSRFYGRVMEQYLKGIAPMEDVRTASARVHAAAEAMNQAKAVMSKSNTKPESKPKSTSQTNSKKRKVEEEDEQDDEEDDDEDSSTSQ